MSTQKPNSHLLFNLVLYAFVCMLLYNIFNVFVILFLNYLSYGDFQIQSSFTALLLSHVGVLKFLQGLSTILIFGLPVFWTYGGWTNSSEFIGWKKTKPNLLFLSIGILICCFPIIQYLGEINAQMTFPKKWQYLEAYLKTLENQGKVITELLLKTKLFSVFFINIIIVAALPALFEELFFRAGIQNILNKMYQNKHLAVLTTAIIFSAVHMQFYGFLPRMLLALIFGYIYIYSGSIWYSILLHFINNALAVTLYFYLSYKNLPLSKADESLHLPLYSYLIFIILTLTLFYKFKKTAEYERKLD